MAGYNGHQTSESYAHEESNANPLPPNGNPPMPSQQIQRPDSRRSSSKPPVSNRIDQHTESNQGTAGYTRSNGMGIHDNHMQQRHRVGSGRSNREQNSNESNCQTWRPVTNSNQVQAPTMAYRQPPTMPNRQNQVQPQTVPYRPSQAQAPAVPYRPGQVQASAAAYRTNHVQAPPLANRQGQAPTLANRQSQVQALTMPHRTTQGMPTRNHEVPTVEVGGVPIAAYGNRIWSYEELKEMYGVNSDQGTYPNYVEPYAVQQARGSYQNSPFALSSSSNGVNPQYRVAEPLAVPQVVPPSVAQQFAAAPTTVQQGPQSYDYSSEGMNSVQERGESSCVAHQQDRVSYDDLSWWIQQQEPMQYGNPSTMMQQPDPTPYINSSGMVEPRHQGSFGNTSGVIPQGNQLASSENLLNTLRTVVEQQDQAANEKSASCCNGTNSSTSPRRQVEEEEEEEELYPSNITQEDLPDRVDDELDRVFEHDQVNWSVHARLLPNKPNAIGPMVHCRNSDLMKFRELIQMENAIRLLCREFKKTNAPSPSTNGSSASTGHNYTGNNYSTSVPPPTQVHGWNGNEERRTQPNKSSRSIPPVTQVYRRRNSNGERRTTPYDSSRPILPASQVHGRNGNEERRTLPNSTGRSIPPVSQVQSWNGNGERRTIPDDTSGLVPLVTQVYSWDNNGEVRIIQEDTSRSIPPVSQVHGRDSNWEQRTPPNNIDITEIAANTVLIGNCIAQMHLNVDDGKSGADLCAKNPDETG